MTRRREHPQRPAKHPGVPNFKGKKIVFASDINIRRLREYVDIVLEAVGHPEALVSDRSRIRDFPVKCSCKDCQGDRYIDRKTGEVVDFRSDDDVPLATIA